MSENVNRPRRGGLEPAAAPALASLSLEELRSYRRDLQEEEEKVSYWRRLVHARLDMLELGATTEGSLTVDQLIRVLGDTGSGASRMALSAVHPAEPLPDLPESRWMWVTEIDPHDPVGLAEAVERLKAAEEKLTTYRKALFERIDTATADLIARYRENPAAALSALPD
ncbi:MAG: RsiG family protein [Sporichthyaceae bacterium]